MSRPKSNAPSDMTPWVKATEKEIDSLKRKVSSLERTSVSPSGNTGGIYGATNVLDVSQTVSGSITANISNANFDTNTTMSSDLDVAGTLSVGQKTRQFTYFDGGLGEYVTEERDAPDFRLVGGQQSVNPVTGVDEYSQAVLSLEDVTLAAFQTHGMIVADGLDIEMQDLADYYYQSEPIQSISNSGGITTITILDTANALATYGPGVYINISGASAYDTTHACINTLTTDSVFITMTIDYTGGTGTVTTGSIMVDYGYLKTKNTIAIQGANPMYQFVRVTQNGFSAGYDGTGLAQESLATNRLGPDGTTASALTVNGNATIDGDTSFGGGFGSTGVSILSNGQVQMSANALSLTNGTGSIQIGSNTQTNLAIDNNDIQCRLSGAGADIFINRLGGDIYVGNSTRGIGVEGNQVWATGVYGNSLTTSYRSVYVSSTDTYDKLGYVASSRDEKKNIEPLSYTAEQILSVPAVEYHYNTEEDSAPKHPGMIAEDLHDAGLHGYVSYDKQGKPASINYEFYVSALQQVVRHQAEQIASLSARLDALEAR